MNSQSLKKNRTKPLTPPSDSHLIQSTPVTAEIADSAVRAMTTEEVDVFFVRLKAQRPEPRTELNYQSAFQLLIAVLLSAQATDVIVNKATAGLFAAAPTAAAMAQLTLDEIKNYIRSIGLYNAKAENIVKTCQILLTQYNGEVPAERAALEALPGVGRKTANVILNTAFGQPTMAVDTHIFRVGNRTGLAIGKTVLAVEKQLLAVIPAPYLIDAHHWLILHGRYCCTARKPKCYQCVVADVCQWSGKPIFAFEEANN